jgi:type III pantothenate kinase
MFWAIDIGNSRVVAGFMKDTQVLKKKIVKTSVLKTESGALRWIKSLQKTGSGEGFIISSVVPQADGSVRKAVQKVSGRVPLFVDPQNTPGIAIHYRKPAEVGADRIVNSLAARELFGAPVIVVDYGTATTFDVVDAQGDYRGGAILAGIGMTLKALRDQTAKLPLVTFAKAGNPIGTMTREGIRSGIHYGSIGATREILLRIRKQLGKVAPAIATGGWCEIFRDTHIFQNIEPDLTLIGLALIWRKQHA